MMEWPLVFLAGILGTGHCVGMCGSFVLMLGGASSSWSALAGRQLLYTAGRMFTYSVLGAVAGFCGLRLEAWGATHRQWLLNVPAILALVTGVFLVYQGLQAAGWLPQGFGRWLWAKLQGKPVPVPLPAGACLTSGLFSSFLKQPDATGAFLAGVFTGLLPCGLLYGMLALAATTRNVALGAMVMAIFGAGTAPGMIFLGLGTRIFSLAVRRHLFAVAAWCLIVTGAISMVRGFTHFSASSEPAPGCPFCKQTK